MDANCCCPTGIQRKSVRLRIKWFFSIWFSGLSSALTEKIVAVLPRMKCPHRIEPHQIQGLDFINIYPVVQVSTFQLFECNVQGLSVFLQWLVRRAIETREELGDTIRMFSESQFNKFHTLPQVAIQVANTLYCCEFFCLF